MDFYNKFVNDLEAIVNRFEEGVSIVMNGENSDIQSSSSSKEDVSEHDYHEMFNEEDIASLDDKELRSLLQEHGDVHETSPLEGIADSVLSDIMKNEVIRQRCIQKCGNPKDSLPTFM